MIWSYEKQCGFNEVLSVVIKLLENEPARKALLMFIKCGGSTSKEAIVSSIIRFDAIISNTENSLGNPLG